MVLIILAVISVNAVLGENGIIRQAEKASKFQANAEASDEEAMDTLLEEYANIMYEEPEPPPTGPNGKLLTSTVTSTDHEGTEAEDTLGNPVYIPGGFKIASDSGSTVKEGIVVEDNDGNQFVWIPVSNIDGSESNPIKIDETNSVVITLGRYTFARTKNDETGLYEDGTPTIVQKGSDWDKTTSAIDKTYQIVDSYIDGYYHYELATNAKSLSNFINSVSTNKGYYLARYEASYVSGSSVNDYKPASKVSTATSFSSSTVGSLWNNVSRRDASKACQNMYSGDSYVESDLVNSYAYDTAIVYIQAMGNANYANQTIENETLRNTGATGDEVCKIFDIAGNLQEWTTEYCTVKNRPETKRGSACVDNLTYAAYRGYGSVGEKLVYTRISCSTL